MSYQIPLQVNILKLKGATKVPLFSMTPTEDVKIRNVIVTMFLSGLISSDFQMKINVYFDSGYRRLLFSSEVVNNFDVVRVGDYYCELRFDFPALRNLLRIGHEYHVEFELSGTYAYDEENYLGLIQDHDNTLGIIFDEDDFVVRLSPFFDKA